MNATLLSQNGKIVGRLTGLYLYEIGQCYCGEVTFIDPPAGFLETLERLDELFQDQVFSRTDELRAKVEAYNLDVQFEDGAKYRLYDMSCGRDSCGTLLFSFKMVGYLGNLDLEKMRQP